VTCELRRDIRRLQLEQDILKKANEIVKKDVGINRQRLTNREKTLLVDALRQTYDLRELLKEVGLARSSYFYHRARLDIADRYVEVRRSLNEIFESNPRRYGYRRMRASLNKQFVSISEKVVQRLMKQECLVVATPKRRRYGSYLGAYFGERDRRFRERDRFERSMLSCVELIVGRGCLKVVEGLLG
jgi:putative transposase